MHADSCNRMGNAKPNGRPSYLPRLSLHHPLDAQLLGDLVGVGGWGGCGAGAGGRGGGQSFRVSGFRGGPRDGEATLLMCAAAPRYLTYREGRGEGTAGFRVQGLGSVLGCGEGGGPAWHAPNPNPQLHKSQLPDRRPTLLQSSPNVCSYSTTNSVLAHWNTGRVSACSTAVHQQVHRVQRTYSKRGMCAALVSDTQHGRRGGARGGRP